MGVGVGREGEREPDAGNKQRSTALGLGGSRLKAWGCRGMDGRAPYECKEKESTDWLEDADPEKAEGGASYGRSWKASLNLGLVGECAMSASLCRLEYWKGCCSGSLWLRTSQSPPWSVDCGSTTPAA
jgi:hypothetical protein